MRNNPPASSVPWSDPPWLADAGPVLVYIAKAPSTAASFNGQGKVWTKIYQSGLLDPSSQQWATDVVNTNGGKHSVTIPASLPAGEYLVRAEIVSALVLQRACLLRMGWTDCTARCIVVPRRPVLCTSPYSV